MARKKKKKHHSNSSKPAWKRKPRPALKAFLVLCVIALAALAIMLSPLFYIKEIEIAGNSKYSNIEIKDAAGLGQSVASGESIFQKSSSGIKRNIEALTYVKNASVTKTYPGKISINITERNVRGYVEYQNMGQYLYIDEAGVVLEVKSYFAETLPVIVGLKFSAFSIGKPLEVENAAAFDNVVTLSSLFAKYEMTDVIKVDVSDENDIHLYIGNIDVLFGSISDADEKVRLAKTCINELDESFRGTLDVKDPYKDPVFRVIN